MPLIENMANWKFHFDRRVIPRGKEDVEPGEQFTGATSEPAKIAGRAFGYSPAKIENLIRGWFGGLGQLGLDLGNYALKPRGIPEPAGSLSDVWMARKFVSRFPGQAESIERFYNEYEAAQEKKNTLDMLKRDRRIDEARTYLKEHREDLIKAARYRATAEGLSTLRKAQDRIRQDKTMTPDIKARRMDALSFRMMDIATR